MRDMTLDEHHNFKNRELSMMPAMIKGSAWSLMCSFSFHLPSTIPSEARMQAHQPRQG